MRDTGFFALQMHFLKMTAVHTTYSTGSEQNLLKIFNRRPTRDNCRQEPRFPDDSKVNMKHEKYQVHLM